MGSGIAQVAAQAGFPVTVVEANDELAKRGLDRLRETLEGLMAKGKLVEVARTILTDEGVVTTATEWVRTVGKTPVQTKDSTAFIVNRLLVPYLLDAVRLYESGLAALEDIDTAMKLGCGYPMGPFTLLDLVGLDTTMYVAEVMFEEFREPRYAPPPLLKRMVLAGRLRRKTGRGFYTDNAPAPRGRPGRSGARPRGGTGRALRGRRPRASRATGGPSAGRAQAGAPRRRRPRGARRRRRSTRQAPGPAPRARSPPRRARGRGRRAARRTRRPRWRR